MKRRWRRVYTDYYTGHRQYGRTGLSLGPGGSVLSLGIYKVATAWTKSNDREWSRTFKTIPAAKRAVERWLERNA